ncbi:MAG: hypothetical protein ONB33_14805 [candidate division KSB1 bacterium]|nr:hypothetical protein [candidate division KSB1 bacterium]MDZ7358864.1 hypothetical protein [candidate division KSB1 bacterium]MDZ7400124.1 hypothetical protein [candidate division KSB1 bacterium]
MAFIKRSWTAAEADEWTKEDLFACIFAVLSYVLLTIGTALSFLLLPIGFITLAAGFVACLIMFWIINPKLKVISADYEQKQKEYLIQLEKSVKWEED